MNNCKGYKAFASACRSIVRATGTYADTTRRWGISSPGAEALPCRARGAVGHHRWRGARGHGPLRAGIFALENLGGLGEDAAVVDFCHRHYETIINWFRYPEPKIVYKNVTGSIRRPFELFGSAASTELYVGLLPKQGKVFVFASIGRRGKGSCPLRLGARRRTARCRPRSRNLLAQGSD